MNQPRHACVIITKRIPKWQCFKAKLQSQYLRKWQWVPHVVETPRGWRLDTFLPSEDSKFRGRVPNRGQPRGSRSVIHKPLETRYSKAPSRAEKLSSAPTQTFHTLGKFQVPMLLPKSRMPPQFPLGDVQAS